MTNNTRQTLLQRLQGKKDDQQAWAEFSLVYAPYLQAFICRMGISSADSADLVQEVLLKVWKNVANFDYDRSRCRFRSWLSTVARNTVLNYLQKCARRPQGEEATIIEFAQESELEHLAEREWKLFIAAKAWEKVTEQFSAEQCEVYLLQSQGKTMKQISEQLQQKENTCYVWSQRLRQEMTRQVRLLSFELDG